MEILLIRHGIAEVRDARRWSDDRERPLSKAGQLRSTHAARGLRRLNIKPELLLSSPFKRAQQSAAILTLAAHWPRRTRCEELSAGSAPEQLLAHLGTLKVSRLALVGHEPDLSKLLALCLGQRGRVAGIEFKKLSVVAVRFARRPAPGLGQLLWLLPPRLLRALR